MKKLTMICSIINIVLGVVLWKLDIDVHLINILGWCAVFFLTIDEK